MKTRFYLIVVFVLSSVNMYGQFESVLLGKEKAAKQIASKTSKSPKAGKISSKGKEKATTNDNNRIDVGKSSSTASINKDDYAFYVNVVRKNGWFVGVGKKLTKEQVSHMYCYYKLSNKNEVGNWTLMQAYNGNGNLTTYHTIDTYLIWSYDTIDIKANIEWQKRLQNVCQWVFIDSYDGKTCIQEKGLDKNGNVIYSMVITPIDSYKYFCTYIDVWGRPAYMHTDSRGSDLGQANFVEVTRDSCGYEILKKYYDRNGFPTKNRNGSYMLSTERDNNGNAVKTCALNVLGQPMIDDFGYCGETKLFDAYGNVLTRINIGLDGKPAKGKDGTFGVWFVYDQYENMTETGYLDKKGQKCSNKDGTFRHVYKYSEYGGLENYNKYDKGGSVINEQAFIQNNELLSDYNSEDNNSHEVDSVNVGEDVTESYQEESSESKEDRFTEESVVDTLNMSVTTYKYDNGVFHSGVVNEFATILGGSNTMYYITPYGAHARTGKALFYKVLFGKNIMGGETMMGINEFGEPAYITTADSKSIVFLLTDETSNGYVDYDEFGIRRKSEEFDTLCLTLPRVFCIEVTDTTQAYPMGIRNNDIILSYGDWRICKDVHSGIEGLYDEIDRIKKLSKTMTILRHHPETQSSEVVILELKKGTPQELGFLPRIIYYTQQEKKRLITTAEAAAFEFSNKAEANNVEVPF